MTKQETIDLLNELKELVEQQLKISDQKLLTSEAIVNDINNEVLKTTYDSLVIEFQQIQEKVSELESKLFNK